MTQGHGLATDPDIVLPYPDQAMFLGLRGAGQEAVMQVLWIYEHPVDDGGLQRFYDTFSRGLLARRVETSVLPFGRHHWVSATGPEANFDRYEHPRDRAELYDWADEQVALPLDPEWGPAWRLGVQPLSDGSTAVSLVVSHCIADGGAVVIALVEAVRGAVRDLGYPRPGSRTRRGRLAADLRQLRRDLPEIGRTLRKAAKLAVRRRGELKQPKQQQSKAVSRTGSTRDNPLVPSASMFIDVKAWDDLAEKLGGNSFSLVAALAAKLGEKLGRTRASDGSVMLLIPVSEREDLSDTRGNAVSIASVGIDPVGVTEDLSAARTAIRDGLKRAREVPDEMMELLPLVPFVPKWAFGRMADVTFGFSSDLPVSCSNMGDIPAELNRVDGTDAEYFCFRGVDRLPSRAVLDRRHGFLTLTSGRIAGKIVFTAVSYQPGQDNSRGNLRRIVAQALDEFGLSSEIV